MAGKLKEWYKIAMDERIITKINSHPYGMFLFGAESGNPLYIQEFSKNEIQEKIKQKSVHVTDYLSSIGFLSDFAKVILTDSSYLEESGVAGEYRNKTIYLYDCKSPMDFNVENLIHEWSHYYFDQMSNDSKDYLRQSFFMLFYRKAFFDNDPELINLLHEEMIQLNPVNPQEIEADEDIFSFDKKEISSFKKEVLNNPMEYPVIMDFLYKKYNFPSGYSITGMEEFWSESIKYYASLNTDLKKIIKSVIQRENK